MARANEVFDGSHMDQIDYRKDYGEVRIISMRRANEREIKKYERRMG